MDELDLFAVVLNIKDDAKRDELLDRECADQPAKRQRLKQLLDAHARSSTLLGPATVGPEPTDAIVFNDQPGAVIAGRYKLLQRIGEGGMGTVWVADQTEPIKRRVAVKLIRVDRGSSQMIVARFEAERQAIALMDHPNIAKLLDAGTTNAGQPFFIMELVKGVPLTEFCDTHKLSVEKRLSLFQQICSAVQHAHMKGVIHRDLKPTNILVESHDDKPVPKVIDFGLAKATSDLQLTENTVFTAFGSVMGTPLYMAPEQAKFNAVDIDTRADIYSLGIILYELLTGTTPITRDTLKKAALDEMLKLVREQEAPSPSSLLSSADLPPSVAANRQSEPAKLGRFVKGELDWIVMKALSKERDRRYETANSFAKDVERFLLHEPVQAGPVSTTYRIRKYVRRNRGQVIAAGLVMAAVLTGMAGTIWGLIEAKKQERIALKESELKEKAREETSKQRDEIMVEKGISVQRLNTYRSTVSQLVNDVPNLLENLPLGSGTRFELLALIGKILDGSTDDGAVGPSIQWGRQAIVLREGESLLDQASADLNRSDKEGIAFDNLKKASQKFAEAVQIAQEVYDQKPQDMAKAAANLATAVSQSAVTHSLMGLPMAEVVPQLKRAIELRREAFAAEKSDDEVIAKRKAELGLELCKYARYLLEVPNNDPVKFSTRAMENAQEAIDLLQSAVNELSADGSIQVTARRDLGTSFSIMASAAQQRGLEEQAKNAYAQCASIFRNLSKDYPNRHQYRKRALESANAYGDYLLENHADLEIIQKQYAFALQELQFTLDTPELRSLQNGSYGMAMQHYRLGLVGLQVGERERAKVHFERCGLLRQIAWYDALENLQSDKGEQELDKAISQRIELMLALARSGNTTAALQHTKWIRERAESLMKAVGADQTAGGLMAKDLFLQAAATYGLVSEHLPPAERQKAIEAALRAVKRSIETGFDRKQYLLRDPDFLPLQNLKQFQQLVSAIGNQ